LKSDLEVKKQTAIEELAADIESCDSVKSSATHQTNVYSVSSHFKNA
jgi:hypothetical protein